MTIEKHRQNLINDLRGVELNATLGSEIEKQSALVIQNAENRNPFVIQQAGTGSLRLTDNGLAGEILIGDQKFVARFDTGSADSWVPSSTCTSDPCNTRTKYDDTKSPTYGPGERKYSDGSSVSGDVKSDNVNVEGIIATGQFFIAATAISNHFKDRHYDGVIGMAMSRSRTGLSKDPFFVTATNQRKVAKSQFAFKLSPPASLYLGGVDDSLYTGEIEFHSLLDNGPLWRLGQASISIGSDKVLSGLRTIIDTGAEMILGPPEEVQTFYSKIPNSEMCNVEGIDFHLWPCPPGQPLPQVSFSWDGKSWPVSIHRTTSIEPGGIFCVGNIGGRDFGHGEKVWLVGEPLLKNVYTIFSLEDDTLGFAALE
ncbi:hypothetical protein Clacol_008757 [Clathrus columnatus]|uniref:Peptidase A1 domain-containing protein n=1 Tax=Clathrus columnatus TaxID=1419009 RepID=A0AAV5ALY2_9AGAM|nr:hypothetical protein Clacol_008757 [Clathrus columnatus]